MITNEAVTEKAFQDRKSLRRAIEDLDDAQAKMLLRRAITTTALSEQARANWRALIG